MAQWKMQLGDTVVEYGDQNDWNVPGWKAYSDAHRPKATITGLLRERDVETVALGMALASVEAGMFAQELGCLLKYAGKAWSPTDAKAIAGQIAATEDLMERAKLFELLVAARRANLGGGSPRAGKTVTFQDGRTATITEGVAP